MSEPAIKPIETNYKGCRFRSRLEARWAVFFDAAGIEWEYEPEGYDIDGVPYLPDFFLRGQKAYVEIKPRGFYGNNRYDSDVMRELQAKLKKLATGTGCDVFLIEGSPSPRPIDTDSETYPGDDVGVIGFLPGKGVSSARFAECPHCGRVSLMCFGGGISPYDSICPCRGGKPFEDTGYNPFDWSPRLLHAMTKGRQARFEHGEAGAP
jgi:hypothetical protein